MLVRALIGPVPQEYHRLRDNENSNSNISLSIHLMRSMGDPDKKPFLSVLDF